MSTMLFLPVLFFLNGLGTHSILQHYIPGYKLLSYKSQQETLGRWNSLLMQLFLIGGYFFASTPEQSIFLNDTFAAYFITDTLHMLFYSYDPIFYVHHSIPLAIYYLGPLLFTSEEANSIFIAGVILEMTSPPISIVWFLGKVGLKPKGYTLLKGFAYLNFLFIRILYFPYYWYMSLTLLPKILLAPFHGMNVYWFYSMTKYVMKDK